MYTVFQTAKFMHRVKMSWKKLGNALQKRRHRYFAVVFMCTVQCFTKIFFRSNNVSLLGFF